MAPSFESGLSKVINMNGGPTQNAKLADLAKDTTDYDGSKHKLTTDWGSKVSNTDHWLSVSTEDRQGEQDLVPCIRRMK